MDVTLTCYGCGSIGHENHILSMQLTKCINKIVDAMQCAFKLAGKTLRRSRVHAKMSPSSFVEEAPSTMPWMNLTSSTLYRTTRGNHRPRTISESLCHSICADRWITSSAVLLRWLSSLNSIYGWLKMTLFVQWLKRSSIGQIASPAILHECTSSKATRWDVTGGTQRGVAKTHVSNQASQRRRRRHR